MTTKDIRTSHAHTVCDVCGRTLLRGERAEIYINGGARRSVCELCRPRALHEGWIREGTLPDYSQSGAGNERRRSLLNRLRNRRDGRARRRPSLDDELSGYEAPDAPGTGRGRGTSRARYEDDLPEEHWDASEPFPESPPAPPPFRAEDEHADSYEDPYEPYDSYENYESYEPEPAEDLLDGPADEASEQEPPPTRRPWSRPPRSLRSQPGESERGGRSSRRSRATEDTSAEHRGVSREPRHVRAVPSGLEQKMAAAVDLFNQSEHRRTVAGVARSLGGAGVAVMPAADPPSLVHIVVWWELCWYRYAVDLSDAVPGVRVDGQGYELDELSDAERSANAAADENGELSLR